MKPVLLTGATGFVGGRFVELFGSRMPLVALVRRPLPRDWPVRQVIGDLCRARDVERAVAGCNGILHIGGATPNRAYADGHFEATTAGTGNLISAARRHGIRRLVFVSSACVEFERPGPYARSKIEAEQLLAESPLEWAVLRPGTIIGPGAIDLGRSLRYWKGAWIVPIPGDGSNAGQPVDVDDVAAACHAALMTPAAARHAIPVAGNDTLTLKQFVTLCLRLLGNSRARVIGIPMPLLQAPAALASRFLPRLGLNPERLRIIAATHRADTTSMKQLLGISPRPVEHALRRAIQALG